MDLFTVLVGVVVFLVLWVLTRRPSRLPPGPPLWPIVGNIFSMQNADLRPTFRKLQQKYGDIFSVYMFHKPFIVLNGYDIIKEALVKRADVFSDRPHDSIFVQLFGRDRGVLTSSGSVWKEQRKFALTTLRDLGMGKSVIEDNIQEEVVAFLQALRDEEGEPFDPTILLQNATSNVICSAVFGKRFEYNCPLFQSQLKSVENIIKGVNNSSIVNIFPILEHFPGDLFNIKFLHEQYTSMKSNLIGPSIEAHMSKRKDFKDDFISAYVEEMDLRQTKDPNTSLNKNNMTPAIIELFVAGTETTSTTLRWTLTYFLNYPEVQEKCFQEINESIGLNRPPAMKDKTCLPYLEATIAETQRMADIAPTGVPHAVSEDVEFRGYIIPKGATILPVLYSVHHDPEIWGDPENFRPERFLDADGNFQKREEIIAFSLGRRVCLGESLARMEMFLFLAAMIQRFEFVTADGVKPSLEGVIGIAHTPKPFDVIAKVRE